MNEKPSIAILGAGSWGVALARVLDANGCATSIWAHLDSDAKHLTKTRSLEPRLPGVVIPSSIHITSDLDACLSQAKVLVLAAPSAFMEDVAQRCAGRSLLAGRLIISATKGLQVGTLRTMTELLCEVWKNEGIDGVVALSGPSHAEEVVQGIPTAVVAAADNVKIAERAQKLMQRPEFRVYTGHDPLGTQLGGALKNVIAIAVGVSDGLGYGDNTRAALITRGLLELSRVGMSRGSLPETFFGLSGLGDLVVTCTSRHSRNRKMGELLAQGNSPQQAEEKIGMVVEGIETSRALDSHRPVLEDEMPIMTEVIRILFHGSEPGESVRRLLSRERKAEWDGMREYLNQKARQTDP
ncbi:MAG: NAD(P)H-dependent glycerol-3-phosphate dehydrogenase [bacterium]